MFIFFLSVPLDGGRHPSFRSNWVGWQWRQGFFLFMRWREGQYRLNIDFPKLKPIKEYIKLQGRFRHLTDDMIEEIEKRVHKEYEQLRAKAGKGV